MNLAASVSLAAGGMRSRLRSLLIWIRDDVDFLSSAYGSVNSRIAVEMPLEFLKVVIAW